MVCFKKRIHFHLVHSHEHEENKPVTVRRFRLKLHANADIHTPLDPLTRNVSILLLHAPNHILSDLHIGTGCQTGCEGGLYLVHGLPDKHVPALGFSCIEHYVGSEFHRSHCSMILRLCSGSCGNTRTYEASQTRRVSPRSESLSWRLRLTTCARGQHPQSRPVKSQPRSTIWDTWAGEGLF